MTFQTISNTWLQLATLPPGPALDWAEIYPVSLQHEGVCVHFPGCLLPHCIQTGSFSLVRWYRILSWNLFDLAIMAWLLRFRSILMLRERSHWKCCYRNSHNKFVFFWTYHRFRKGIRLQLSEGKSSSTSLLHACGSLPRSSTLILWSRSERLLKFSVSAEPMSSEKQSIFFWIIKCCTEATSSKRHK